MAGARYEFDADLWEHDGPASWWFVSLPEEHADDVEERFGRHAGGFGSVRVRVTIGATTWATSLFPDSRRATYVLPVKAAVRRAEGLGEGSRARVAIEIVTP